MTDSHYKSTVINTDLLTTDPSILSQSQSLNFSTSSTLPIYTMSNATSSAPPGNPKRGGALFKFPREIRDEIYRLLVKDRYLVGKPSTLVSEADSKSLSKADVAENVRPGFAILRVSKVVGYEAAEILYSESVFRYVIDPWSATVGRVDEMLCRLKKVAPRLKNVYIDVDGGLMTYAAEFGTRGHYLLAGGFEMSSDLIIDVFGNDTKRQTLHIRFFSCTPGMLGGSSFITICRRLRTLLGFHVANVEVTLLGEMDALYVEAEFDVTEPSKTARNLVRSLIHAVKEQLEPGFGPSTSGFRSGTGNVPTLEDQFLSLNDTSLVGYLQFHPEKHSATKSATEEDR